MEANNYIIKGTFFRVGLQKQSVYNELIELQSIIKEYFIRKNYLDASPSRGREIFFEQNFLLSFRADKISKTKILLGQDAQTQSDKQHFKNLKKTRVDVPYNLKVHAYPGAHNGKEGFFIEIISKPVKYMNITQLNESPEMSPQQYSFIVSENIECLNSFARANLCQTIKEPAPMNIFAKTEVSEKLKKLGFIKLGELLERAKEKLETGKDIEAIDDLNGIIENFFVELIKKLKETPFPLSNPEKNIQLLEKMGYLTPEMEGVIKGIFYQNVYRILKTPAHEREHKDLFDLRYFYEVIERGIDYLLERIYKYKIFNIKK
jgi:hypothetical protein